MLPKTVHGTKTPKHVLGRVTFSDSGDCGSPYVSVSCTSRAASQTAIDCGLSIFERSNNPSLCFMRASASSLTKAAPLSLFQAISRSTVALAPFFSWTKNPSPLHVQSPPFFPNTYPHTELHHIGKSNGGHVNHPRRLCWARELSQISSGEN